MHVSLSAVQGSADKIRTPLMEGDLKVVSFFIRFIGSPQGCITAPFTSSSLRYYTLQLPLDWLKGNATIKKGNAYMCGFCDPAHLNIGKFNTGLIVLNKTNKQNKNKCTRNIVCFLSFIGGFSFFDQIIV